MAEGRGRLAVRVRWSPIGIEAAILGVLIGLSAGIALVSAARWLIG